MVIIIIITIIIIIIIIIIIAGCSGHPQLNLRLLEEHKV